MFTMSDNMSGMSEIDSRTEVEADEAGKVRI